MKKPKAGTGEHMKVKTAFIFLLLGLYLLAPSVYAATPTQSFDGLLELIEQSSDSWFEKLLDPAKTLFFGLALIAIVLKIGPLIFDGPDFGKLMGEVFWLFLTLGFFYALMIYSQEWGSAVVDSFREAGGSAIGLGKALNPADVFTMGVDLANTVGSAKTWNPLEGVMIAVSALLVLLSYVFMAAFLAVAIVESIIVINAAVLFLGFGALPQTREYAMAMPRYAVSVGAKLFVITLIVGLISKAGNDWKAAYDFSQTSMWTLVGLCLVSAVLAKTIPDLVQGLISGTSMGGGQAIGGTAGQAVAGLAAVATAGVAAAAALSKVAESLPGGGSGGSNLSQSLSESLQLGGGDNPASSSPALGGGDDNPSGGGNGGANTSALTAGSRIGGGAGNGAELSSSSSSDASREAGPSPSNTNKSSAQIAEEQLKAGKPQNDSEGSAANAGYKIADAAVRSIGLGTAMTMPGAEGAASASLGPNANIGETETDSPMSEIKGDDDTENTIRPVGSSIANMQVPGMDTDGKFKA